MTAKALEATLQARVGFEVIQQQVKENQIRFFGRVRPSHMPTWLLAMRALLLSTEGAPWSVDLSRQYFLRGEKLFFGWRIIIQSNNIQEQLPTIISIIQSVQYVQAQVDEVPLHVRADRNALRNGKGAQPTATAIVGPLARASMGS